MALGHAVALLNGYSSLLGDRGHRTESGKIRGCTSDGEYVYDYPLVIKRAT